MKKALVLAGLLGVALPLHANCGNGNGNGEGCEGGGSNQGPAGANGTNGTNGAAGANGSNGLNASESGPKRALQGEIDVRLLDTKHTALYAFNSYGFDDSPTHDTVLDGRNATYGVKLVLKLGRSYEEGLIARQDAKIKGLEAALSRLQQ
jgi:hypothetical protein